MRESENRARAFACFVIAVSVFLVSTEAAAQFQLRSDAISALGDFSSTSNLNLLMSVGQAHPTENTSSASQIVRPGFIPSLPGFAAADCSVRAWVDLPIEVLENRQFTVAVLVDMRACRPPDDRLGSFSSRLSWDTSLLRFVNHSDILAGFTGVVNTANANAGELDFNGSNAGGVAGDFKILTVTFEVVGNSGTNGIVELDFSAMAAAGTFADLLPRLTTTNGAFRIIRSDCQVCGDVSDDGASNSTDALIVLSYDAGVTLPPALLDKINAGCGDVNTDGATNSTDALIILSHDAGLAVPFPVGNPGGCSSARAREARTEKKGGQIEN